MTYQSLEHGGTYSNLQADLDSGRPDAGIYADPYFEANYLDHSSPTSAWTRSCLAQAMAHPIKFIFDGISE